MYYKKFYRLKRTPYLTNSKKILTVAHLGVFLGDFWSTTYRQTPLTTRSAIENGRGQRKSGRGFKNFAHSARDYYKRTPLCRILDPPLILYPIVSTYSTHRVCLMVTSYSALLCFNVSAYSAMWCPPIIPY